MPEITLLPVPENLPIWRARDIERLRPKLEADTYVGAQGELIWKSNDHPVPLDVFRDACVEAPANQKAAYDAYTQAFLAEYRRVNANRELSAEERYEARAAFGPGATIVDAVTGQKWTV